jgi:predicted transcriptional regulator
MENNENIKKVPREEWGDVKVSDVVVSHSRRWEISPETDLIKALELMLNEDRGRLVVTDGGKVIGLITRNGIARYMQIMGS